MKKPRILGLIVARKNSKGLKNKHLLKIKNKPCIEWTFKAASSSKNIDYCLLSTDSLKIIKISKKYNIDAPFKRPSILSKDNTSIYDVISHSLKWCKKNNKNFDLIVLLQGSSPLRKNFHIDEAIKLFQRTKKVKSLISGYKASNKNYWLLKKKHGLVKFIFKQNKVLRRQNNENHFLPNGAIFISKINNLKNFYSNRTILYEMDEKDSVDIDTKEDLELAKNNMKKLSY